MVGSSTPQRRSPVYEYLAHKPREGRGWKICCGRRVALKICPRCQTCSIDSQLTCQTCSGSMLALPGIRPATGQTGPSGQPRPSQRKPNNCQSVSNVILWLLQRVALPRAGNKSQSHRCDWDADMAASHAQLKGFQQMQLGRCPQIVPKAFA